jgi:peptidoglycan/xylan/chitin deacetylase (PgdA/CDA1 family)
VGDQAPARSSFGPGRDLAGRVTRRARRVRSIAVERLARAPRRSAGDAVALTFDDGPQPGSTDRILDVLADLDVRATFFCVGKNAERHPELLLRVRQEGHAIGSHSYSHPDPAKTPLATLAGDYRRGRQVIADILGKDVTLFRPPRGHLTPVTALMVRVQGLRPWLWSVDPEDWRPGAASDHIEAVAGGAVGADVVLLHDWIEQPWGPEALDRSATVSALPGIVAAIRGRGAVLDRLGP